MFKGKQAWQRNATSRCYSNLLVKTWKLQSASLKDTFNRERMLPTSMEKLAMIMINSPCYLCFQVICNNILFIINAFV